MAVVGQNSRVCHHGDGDGNENFKNQLVKREFKTPRWRRLQKRRLKSDFANYETLVSAIIPTRSQCFKPGFHMIAAIDEKKVQRSQRSYGNHSSQLSQRQQKYQDALRTFTLFKMAAN